MKKIKLTQGKYALVDDIDFNYLNQWKWYYHKTGYAIRDVWYPSEKRREKVRMHRVIAKTPEDMVTDHVNQDKLDNRRSNLRICTTPENLFNRPAYKDRLYKGTQKNGKKWVAKIVFNKRQYYVGIFKTELEAAEAYNNKAKELHGSFANLNQIGEINASV